MALEHDHAPEAIRERLAAELKPNYLRDFVYGAIDGAVTTFAVVAGVEGASLATRVVVILGLANLFADGFSMAASNYSGTKAELDDARRLADVERRHIREEPDGEREEIRQILLGKGLVGDALETAVTAITSREETWVSMMLAEEYGVPPVLRSPMLSAASTFAAFLIAGAVPLIPFVAGSPRAFAISALLVGCVFFAIGSMKSRWSLQRWWLSGLETFAIGAAAASVAYLVGYLLRGLS